MNKALIKELIVAQLRAGLELQTRAALLARDEAISEESRPENQYDMHSQEAAYLAEGQARHAAETLETLKLYENLPAEPFGPDAPVAIGALVEIGLGRSAPVWYFIGPRGGGLSIEEDGRSVLVLTPQSPLGRELLGKRPGTPVRLPGPTPTTSPRIISVR